MKQSHPTRLSRPTTLYPRPTPNKTKRLHPFSTHHWGELSQTKVQAIGVVVIPSWKQHKRHERMNCTYDQIGLNNKIIHQNSTCNHCIRCLRILRCQSENPGLTTTCLLWGGLLYISSFPSSTSNTSTLLAHKLSWSLLRIHMCMILLMHLLVRLSY